MKNLEMEVEPLWVSAKTAMKILDVSRSYFERNVKRNLNPIILGKSRTAGLRYELLEIKAFCANLKKTTCVSLLEEEEWRFNSYKEAKTECGTSGGISSENTLMKVLSALKEKKQKRR